MKTCPDCGERVYNLGCVNCNESAYIDEQERLTDLIEGDDENYDPTPWELPGDPAGPRCDAIHREDEARRLKR